MTEEEKKAMDSYEGFLKDVTRFAGGDEERDNVDHPKLEGQREDLVVKVGERVRQVREKRGLSREDISSRTDIDMTLLSQIEEGKVAPPLGTIIKLAKALEMEMGYFISGKGDQTYTIVRREDRKIVSRHDSKKVNQYGYEFQSLAPLKKNRHMEPFLVTLEPSDTKEGRNDKRGNK